MNSRHDSGGSAVKAAGAEGATLSHDRRKPLRPNCTVQGCRRPEKANGYCSMHYRRWVRTGVAEQRYCAKCQRPIRGDNTTGYCKSHSYIPYVNTPEAIAKRKAKWANMPPEKRAAHRAINNLASRRWRERNEDRKRAINLSWVERNRERHLLIQKRARDKMRATIKEKLRHQIQTQMRNSLKDRKPGRKWERRVGYTVDQLAARLEGLFTEGMTWEKFHAGEIHLDHIRPLSMFEINSADDPAFRECWALSNLQPLWESDHRAKSAAESVLRAKAIRLSDRYAVMQIRRQIGTGDSKEAANWPPKEEG